ncbi:MAG: hypothetical protein MN733_35850, partial [Nitrososphaera sp.]|nr:hypothetical protein [Nitrososphaera sp.]
MKYSKVERLVVTFGLLGALSLLLSLGGAPIVVADNLVNNGGDITMNVGTTNSQLKVKIVSNSAQSQSGDPQSEPACNVADGSVATVNLHISPGQGLTYSPNPLVFTECNKAKTVTLSAEIGGTYTITASVDDAGTGGNSPLDVYHTEPFGTVTVIVIDTIPPETTIDSGPGNPTASQSAEFTFSADENGSTFECSLDGAAFTACTSPTSYSDLAVGDHTFAVRATDPSGNTDESPDTFEWTIKAVTVDITSVTPDTTIWGSLLSAGGVADVVDLASPELVINWGDGQTDSAPVITGSWGPLEHTYMTAGSFTITANVTEGGLSKAFDTFGVTINKHQTALSLNMSQFVTGTTKFLLSGFLNDTSIGGVGIPGRTIDFDGASAPADTLTEGVTFNGQLDLVSCTSCTDDPAPVNASSSSSDNIVLHLGVGGNITFPSSSAQAIVYLQDMGSTPFKYRVIEYPDTVQDCDEDSPGVQEECTSIPDPTKVSKINAISGYVTVGEVKVHNGIKAILITEVDGSTSTGSIGISAVYTGGIDTEPTDQHLINFEDLSPSSPSSPLTINPGAYHAIGVAQEDPAAGLLMEAEFDGDALYEASSSGPIVYNVRANLNGLGASFAPEGSGTSVTEYACAGLSDFDEDGICDEFETNPFEIFIEGISPTVSWPFPAGEEPDAGLPDVYYEIDCMTGFCPTQTELNYIEGRFSMEGIRMHLMLDQTNLTV